MTTAVAHRLDDLLGSYGSPLVGLVVGLEAMGLPLPGESMIIGSAVYCATSHKLSIVSVLVAAAIGAIMGDNAGYGIGRAIGYRLLARYGRKVGLSEDRLMLGQYLFRRYGGPVVFTARFVAVLRTFAALLAGANRMGWARFLFWNAVGGITWTAGYGLAAFFAARAVERLRGSFETGLIVVAVPLAGLAIWFLKRNEHRLTEEARRAAAAEPRKGGRRSGTPGVEATPRAAEGVEAAGAAGVAGAGSGGIDRHG